MHMKNSTTPRRKAKKRSGPELDNGRVRIHPSKPFTYEVPDDRLAPYLFAGDEVELNPTLQAKPGDIVLTTSANGDPVFELGHLLKGKGGEFVVDIGRDACERRKVVAVHRKD